MTLAAADGIRIADALERIADAQEAQALIELIGYLGGSGPEMDRHNLRLNVLRQRISDRGAG